jgi:hypothetical protein
MHEETRAARGFSSKTRQTWGFPMIASILDNALSGLNNAAQRVYNASSSIVNASSTPSAPAHTDASPGSQPGGQDLSTALVGLKVDSVLYQANAKVVKVAGEIEKSLIDIKT